METPAKYDVIHGQVVKPRETMMILPKMKIKGGELLFKDGNKIIDRIPLARFIEFCEQTGLHNLIEHLGIADRARVNQGDAATMIYGLPVLQKRYLSASDGDRAAILEKMTESEAKSFLDDIARRMGLDGQSGNLLPVTISEL